MKKRVINSVVVLAVICMSMLSTMIVQARTICKDPHCGNTATYSDGYCGRHTGSKNSGSSYSHRPSYKSSSSTLSDPYDVYDYDDADDFADEWEDEFDDWEAAWDYWDEHH